MNFPWPDRYNHKSRIFYVVNVLKALALPNQRRKQILLDWCKEVDYPHDLDLFQLLWGEIDQSQYLRRKAHDLDFLFLADQVGTPERTS